MTQNERRLLVRTLGLGILLTLLVAALYFAGYLDPLDNFLYDRRLAYGQHFLRAPTDKLVHLDIDDGALESIGSWPWPRAILADILDELRLAQAKVIGMDIIFSEPDKIDPSNDEKFTEAIQRCGNVLMGASLIYTPPPHTSLLYDAVLTELLRDLEVKPDELQARLVKRSIPNAQRTEHFEKAFYDARRRAMRERIEQEFLRGDVDFATLRRRLLPNTSEVFTGSPVISLLREQDEQVRGVIALQRIARAAPPDLTSVLKASAVRATISRLADKTAAIGFVDYLPFREGVVRSVPLWCEYRGKLIPQFGLALACLALDLKLDEVRFGPNEIILAPRDGPQRVIPTYTAVSDVHGRVGTFIDIPFFGKGGESSWETMYDVEHHKEIKQHLSIKVVYSICDALRRVKKNNENIDRALFDVHKAPGGVALDPAAFDAFDANRPPLDDTAARAGFVQKSVASIDLLLPVFEGIKDSDLDEKDRKDKRVLLTARQVMIAAIEQNTLLSAQIDEARRMLQSRLRNRAILIGWTAQGKIDYVHTSLEPLCPGEVVHGAIFNAIMTGELWHRAPQWVCYFSIFAAGILTTLLVAYLHTPWKALAAIVALLLGYLLVDAILVFDYGDTVVSTAGPVTAVGLVWSGLNLMRFIIERAERRRITRRFQSYVDPTLVNWVIEHPDRARLDGENREMTVVFTDLGGFTTLAEKLREGSVHMLNEYMSIMVPIIRKYRGYVNKFLGDGIMFFYNAPLANPNHAIDAVETVLEMQRALVEFNQKLTTRNLPTVLMRAGINTGDMIVGDAGPVEGCDYTVLGDSVNLASRLESANKATGTLVMLSGRTAELVSDRYLLRPLGLLRVKGKTEGVMTYSPLACREQATEDQKRLAGLSTGVVDHFMAGRFQACLDDIESMEGIFGSSTFTELYAEHCREYLQNPPAKFDGQIVLHEK